MTPKQGQVAWDVVGVGPLLIAISDRDEPTIEALLREHRWLVGWARDYARGRCVCEHCKKVCTYTGDMQDLPILTATTVLFGTRVVTTLCLGCADEHANVDTAAQALADLSVGTLEGAISAAILKAGIRDDQREGPR